MAISLSNNYFNSTANNVNQSAVVSIDSNASVALGNSADSLSLKQGQTLSGEIISNEGGNVTLKLNDGQLINARLAGNIDLSVGRLLSFEVKSTDSNTISLRPLYSNLNNNSTVVTALKAAGLSLSDTNISMTKSMMEEGMSINRNALMSMAKDVNAFHFASPSSIVQMAKMGLAIDEISVTQYENYRNFEHQIVGDVTKLTDGLSESLFNALNDDGDYVDITRDILSLIDSTALNNESEEPVLQNGNNIDSFQSQNVTVNQETSAELSEQLNPELSQTVLNLNTDTEQPLVINNNFETESTINNTKESSLPINTLIELSKETGIKSPEIFNPKETIDFLKNVADYIKNNKEDDISELLRHFNSALSNNEIKNVIKDSLRAQLTISPESISKDGEIENLYNRILRFSQKAMEIANQNGNMNEVVSSAQNLQDNVHFMDQLNQFVNYVQLPLKMYQENAHGELYVYSKKKNLSENDGNLTALLHLDMEHLGPMDVYVSMQNYTNVTTNFRLANEEVLDFIEANINILNERLVAKGYNMTCNVTTGGSITGEDNPITDEFFKESPEDGAVREVVDLQFDVRA